MQFSVPTLAAGIVIGIAAGALATSSLTHRYYISGRATNFIKLDRLTGELQYCSINECEPVTVKSATSYARAN
jgi:hypothetical protein